jgi:hypothetical protein
MITHYDIINANMELNYLGDKSFKFKNKSITLLINPNGNKEKADVVVMTAGNAMPTIATLTRNEVFQITEEGEYELGGVGIIVSKVKGGNISYVFMDGVRVAYLFGDSFELSDKQLETLNESDVILTSINLDKSLIGKLDPYILIPFGQSGQTDVDKFISENKFGTVVPNLDKIKLDPDSLPEDTQVWVLNG